MWHRDPFEELHAPAERRHQPAVLVFLVLLALLFSFQVIVNLWAITDEKTLATLSKFPIPPWAYGIQALCGALNLMWIVAIFFWQRLGFYGFLVTSLGITGINLACNFAPHLAGLPLVSVALLFVALHLGASRSTWRQMR